MRCGQIRVHPGLFGQGVEDPCPHEARWQLGEDPTWVVCEWCRADLEKEGIEEASHARAL
jgi:hypothetical protein